MAIPKKPFWTTIGIESSVSGRQTVIALVAQERMESLYAERESFIPSVNTDAGKEAFNDYISFEVAKLRMEVVACELYDFLALFGTVSWDLRS
jgi:hypothetical protein